MTNAARRLSPAELDALTRRLAARVPRDPSAIAPRASVVDISTRKPLGLRPLDTDEPPERDAAKGAPFRSTLWDTPRPRRTSREGRADRGARRGRSDAHGSGGRPRLEPRREGRARSARRTWFARADRAGGAEGRAWGESGRVRARSWGLCGHVGFERRRAGGPTLPQAHVRTFRTRDRGRGRRGLNAAPETASTAISRGRYGQASGTERPPAGAALASTPARTQHNLRSRPFEQGLTIRASRSGVISGSNGRRRRQP